MIKKSEIKAAIVFSLLVLLGSVQAAFIEPVIITVSSEVNATYEADNLIAGDAGPITSSADTFNTDNYGTFGWQSSAFPTPTLPQWIKYDFGTAIELTELVLWNWIRDVSALNNGTDRSIQDFTISFSNDGSNYSAGTAYTAVRATSTTAEAGQVFDFEDVTARYAKLTITSNHGATDFVALNELHFMTGSVIPVFAVDDLYRVAQNSAATTCHILLNDSSSDPDTVIVLDSFDSTSAQGGTVSDNGEGTLDYTPATNFAGLDTFSYTITDSLGGYSTGTVRIEVNVPFDISAARSQILSGVGTLADPSGADSMVVYAQTACSIGNYTGQDHRDPMIASGTLGTGRVLTLPDSDWLDMDTHGSASDTGQFYVNGLSWLAGTTSQSIKIVVTPGSSAQSWLDAQGYTHAVQSGDYAAELSDADVLVGWLGSDLSAADSETILEFVRDGGGLFVCDDDTTSPFHVNELLRHAGIGISTYDPAGGLTITPATGQTDLLFLLDSDPTEYSTTDSEIGCVMYDRLDQILGSNDSLWLTIDHKTWQERIPKIIPRPDHAVSDPLEKKLILMEIDRLNAVPVTEVAAHRTAEPCFGAIAPDAPRVDRTISIDTSLTRWHATGLYLFPGDLATVTVPAAVINEDFKIQISGHRDNLSPARDSWQRMPNDVDRAFNVENIQTQIASPYGGAIYVNLGSTLSSVGDFDITFENVIEAPMFVLGETTNEEWVNLHRHKPAPYAELVSPHVAFSLPASDIRDLSEAVELMTFWDGVVQGYDALAGYDSIRTMADRINIDVQISNGAAHAGYPIQAALEWEDSTSSNLPLLKQEGYWGFFHELGHEVQRRPDKAWEWVNCYTFNTSVEATVNIFSAYASETMTETGGWTWTQSAPGAVGEALAIVADGGTYDTANNGKLAFHLILRWAFGWDAMQAVLTGYTQDHPNVPTDEQDKRDQYLLRWSNQVGYNLTHYFRDVYGLEITQSVANTLNGLPDWKYAVGGTEEVTVLDSPLVMDLQGSTVSFDDTATVQNVTQPDHGTITDNGNGTWTFTPESGYFGLDAFTYEVVSSTGFVATTTVTVSIDPFSFEEPVTVTASSTYPGGNYSKDGLTNGDEDGPITSPADRYNTGTYGTLGWVSGAAPTPASPQWVKYDFGSNVQLGSVVLWNWIRALSTNDYFRTRGVRDFTVSFSTNGSNYSNETAYTAAIAASTNAELAQIFEFPPVTARYVKLTITSNYGDDYVGINELWFGGQSPLNSKDWAPENVIATAGNSVVTLNWDDKTGPDPTGYNVYRSTHKGYHKIAIAVPDSAYTDTSAVNGITHAYQMTALYTDGYESRFSDPLSARKLFDGAVGLSDFAVFSSKWLSQNCDVCWGTDLTGDGKVGLDDVQEFAQNWLQDL